MDNETQEVTASAITEAVVPSPVLYKFTNQEVSHDLDNILAMFYQGVYANSIGIMQAFNLDTSEEELILVGVQLDEEGKADCFPLATIFSAEQARKYAAPDGKGGWYDPANAVETAEAKENMKSYDSAVVDTVVQTN